MSDDNTINLDEPKNKKLKKHTEQKLFDQLHELHESKEQESYSETTFLPVYKRGVKKVGEEFFIIKYETVDLAESKWDLVCQI